MIIYKTTNLINKKFYIGKDTKNNPKYFGSGKKLKLAIKKYGIENFIKEIVEICDNLEQLNEREKFWIKELNAINEGYNISLGGDGGDTISNNPNKEKISKIHSEKMKLLQYNKKKGTKIVKPKKRDNPNWVNPLKGKKKPFNGNKINRKYTKNPSHSEWMKKNNPFKGKTHSKEVIEKIRESAKRPKSNEHKRKISETLKGNKPGNMRQIIIYGVTYESLSEAARQLLLPLSTIKNRLKSNSKKFINWNYE